MRKKHVIRMRRIGRYKHPVYHIVVAPAKSSVRGRFIEKVGFYNPLSQESYAFFDLNQLGKALLKGARPINKSSFLLSILLYCFLSRNKRMRITHDFKVSQGKNIITDENYYFGYFEEKEKLVHLIRGKEFMVRIKKQYGYVRDTYLRITELFRIKKMIIKIKKIESNYKLRIQIFMFIRYNILFAKVEHWKSRVLLDSTGIDESPEYIWRKLERLVDFGTMMKKENRKKVRFGRKQELVFKLIKWFWIEYSLCEYYSELTKTYYDVVRYTNIWLYYLIVHVWADLKKYDPDEIVATCIFIRGPYSLSLNTITRGLLKVLTKVENYRKKLKKSVDDLKRGYFKFKRAYMLIKKKIKLKRRKLLEYKNLEHLILAEKPKIKKIHKQEVMNYKRQLVYKRYESFKILCTNYALLEFHDMFYGITVIYFYLKYLRLLLVYTTKYMNKQVVAEINRDIQKGSRKLVLNKLNLFLEQETMWEKQMFKIYQPYKLLCSFAQILETKDIRFLSVSEINPEFDINMNPAILGFDPIVSNFYIDPNSWLMLVSCKRKKNKGLKLIRYMRQGIDPPTSIVSELWRWPVQGAKPVPIERRAWRWTDNYEIANMDKDEDYMMMGYQRIDVFFDTQFNNKIYKNCKWNK